LANKAKPKTDVLERERKETPLVAYFMAFVFALLGYVVLGKIILAARPHPIHWLSAILGGVLGYFLGLLWFRWKGDIL
jgi:hypothetical protein